MYVWMQVTKDRFELPVVLADTAEELAKKVGTSAASIYSSISHANAKGYHCQFVRVKL